MSTNRQIVEFDWKVPATEVHDRDLPPGRTTIMRNTRRTVAGAIEKRNGFDKTTVSSFIGGTYAGPATGAVGSSVPIVRDTSGQFWAIEGSTGYYRGADRRATPEWTEGKTLLQSCSKPVSVLRSGKLWEFVYGLTSAGAGAYQLTVTDVATGVVERQDTTASGTMVSLAACLDSSNNVWLFFVANGTTITAHKFTAVTGAGASTTLLTQAGAKFTSVDAVLLTGTSQVVVGATHFDVVGGQNVTGRVVAIVNTSTGVASSSNYTTNNTAPAAYPQCSGGISLWGTGADGYVYLSRWRTTPAVADQAELRLERIALSGFGTTERQLRTHTISIPGAGSVICGNSAGVINGSAHDVLSSAIDDLVASPEQTYVSRTTVVGLGTGGELISSTGIALAAWLASKPFLHSGAFYFLSGYDSGIKAVNQLSYYVRDLSGNILCPLLEGDGSVVFFEPLPATSGGEVFPEVYTGHVTSVHGAGSSLFVAGLLTTGLVPENPAPATARINFAPVVHSTAPNIIAGGVPKYVSESDTLFAVSPLVPPHIAPALQANGGGASIGDYRITYRYVRRDGEGRLYRSSPYPLPPTLTLNAGMPGGIYTFDVASDRHAIGESWIEFYGSLANQTDLFLQTTVQNVPGANVTSISVAPQLFDSDGELLDTTGGALDQAPLPSARLAHVHGDRLWLAGTPKDEVWYSQRRRAGRGWEFNEVLVAEWPEGSSSIQAIGSENADMLVLFKRDAIGYINTTGGGPDGLGSGAVFTVQTILGRGGCSNPASVVSARGTLYFQRHADGRLCALSGGQVVELTGQESYSGYTVSAAVYNESARAVNFHCSNGKTLQLQLGFASTDSPLGELVEFTSSAIDAEPAIGIVGTGFLVAGTSGAVAYWTQGAGFTDNGTAVLKRFKTTRFGVGFMREFDLDHVWISSTVLGGSSAYRYTIYHDWGFEDHPDNASATADVSFRASAFHTREISMEVTETTATGQGRQFDGCALELLPYGRIKRTPRKVA